MSKVSKLRVWAQDVGMLDRGIARLLGVSRWTAISWRRDDDGAREPGNWCRRLIAGLEQEVARLKAHDDAASDVDWPG